MHINKNFYFFAIMMNALWPEERMREGRILSRKVACVGHTEKLEVLLINAFQSGR